MPPLDKLVFFEELNQYSRASILSYIKKGFKAYFFSIDKKFETDATITKYIGEGKLVDISTLIFDYSSYAQSAACAHDSLDKIFEKYFSSSRSIALLGKLLDFPEIQNVYKYQLLSELQRIYFIQLRINEIIKTEDSKENLLIPSDHAKFYTDQFSILSRNVKVLPGTGFSMSLRKLPKFFGKSLSLFVPLILLLKKFGGISRSIKRKEYKVGIMDDYPENILSMNYFGNNVFLDDKELPKKDVLLLVPWKKQKLKLEKEKGYHCTSVYDGRETISFSFLKKLLLNFTPAWLQSFFYSFFQDPLVINTNKSILSNYILWNIFVDNYKINNYVKRLLPDNQSKLHILSQSGVKTWFVFPDNTSHDSHLDWDHSKKNVVLYSFMNFDNAIIHGDIHERFFKKHRNFIKNYIKTGVLFSQTAKEIENRKLKSPIFELMKSKNMPNKILGVFDTTFVDYGPVKVDDGVVFANNILRLLNDFPNIGIIFKAAKEYELTPLEILPIYEKLKYHPRCLFFYRFSKEGISAPEVVAASDLTISVSYISTTAEALGARKRAFYYDPGGRDIGKGFYYNNFPNFVAHNYEELKKLTNYWLFEQNDKDFDNFLNKYVKNEMDPYLDAKGFSRLRRLLTQSSKDLNEVQAD